MDDAKQNNVVFSDTFELSLDCDEWFKTQMLCNLYSLFIKCLIWTSIFLNHALVVYKLL
jgi:hypothetical protein